MLSCVLLTIWWVLVGGRLGEPEDEDDEKDSSAVLVEVVEEYVIEVVVQEEESQWWGPHEKRGLEQWKVTETWRWGSVVKAWE